MLSSNMLLPNLIPLIDVTFSTPTGDSAQNGGQDASSAKNLAKERIGFSLSSHKPRSSFSLSRFSYKSLPKTCMGCEW